MRIDAAVLLESGRSRPYADSQPIVVTSLELDEPGPGEIAVRIEAAGVCHSDLSVVDGNRLRPLPMALGHEAAGIVTALGVGVDDLAIGTRVVMAFLPRCGDCPQCDTDGRLPCGPGSVANNEGTLLSGDRRLHATADSKLDSNTLVHHHLGVSGFATHAVVDRRSVTAVGDDVPAEIAAVLGCAVLTGGGAVINAGTPRAGQSIMVVGLGGVGMAAILTALSLELGDVIGVDAVDAKLTSAQELGATAVYTPAHVVEQGITADIVIEAAGNTRAFETAVAATAPGGITVTVGLPSPEARSTITPLALVAGARTITGSYLGSAVPSRDIPVYEQLWRDGKLPVEKLISSRIRLADINSALDALADGAAIRQVITFD